MSKRNLFLFLFCLVALVSIIGCGSSDGEDYITVGGQEQPVVTPVTPKEGHIVDNRLFPIVVNGMTLSSPKGNFDSDARITVTEQQFPAGNNRFLVSGNKIYTIKGELKKYLGSSLITNVEEGINVTLPNPFYNIQNVDTYYVGTRKNQYDTWRFTRLNNSYFNTRAEVISIRADYGKPEYEYNTNELGFDIALFAKVNGSNLQVPSGSLDGISAETKGKGSDKAKPGQIKTKDNYYTEDMVVVIKLAGTGLENINKDDYVVELVYQNEISNINKKLAGSDSNYETPALEAANGKKYVHRLTIGNVEWTTSELRVTLNTKGMHVSEFSMNFSIMVRSSGRSADVLPFTYSENEKIEGVEDGADQLPQPIISYSQKTVYTLGEPIELAWEAVKSPVASEVFYDVTLVLPDGNHQMIASAQQDCFCSITDLPIGSYSVFVTAYDYVTSSDSKLFSFEVTGSEVQPLVQPIIEPLEKSVYKYGEDIVLKWSDNGQTNASYAVWLWPSNTEKPVEPTYTGISENTYTISNLATGSYVAAVAAVDGERASAPAIFGDIIVIATTAVTFNDTLNTKAEDGSLSVYPEFIVSLSENNFDTKTVENAITVTPSDAAILHREWIDNTLHLTFEAPLAHDAEYTISMTNIKDVYGNDMVVFKAYTFKARSESGTEENPIMMNPVEFYDITAEGKIPLIASVSVEIATLSNVVFGSATIKSADGSVNWENLRVYQDKNTITVGIPEDALWPADAKISGTLTLTGTINNKLMFYKAVILEFQTEDGKKITQGKGVDEAPYLVYTPAQLDDVRNYLSASFLQLRDIDLANPAIDNFDSARGWLPIGSWDYSTYSGNPFVGHYNGNYRKITGFYIERPDEDCVGLFGCVAGDCSVKNMIIEGTSVTGNEYVGSVIGCCFDPYGTTVTDNAHFCMENIANYVTVRGGYSAGGLIGFVEYGWYEPNTFSIVGCKNNSDVHGKGFVGGVVGYAPGNDNISITNCRFTGSVTGTGTGETSVGGIAGSVGGKITDCFVEGIICASATTTTTYCCCGGLIGSASGDISNCKFSGSVFSEMPDNSYIENDGTGGLIGNLWPYQNESISNCSVENAVIEGNSIIGGLVGNCGYGVDCIGCVVKNSSIKAKSGEFSCCGGLIGYIGSYYVDEDLDVVINNCNVENCNITGYAYTGGLVGVASEFKSIENSNVNNVSIEGQGCVAGLVGILGCNFDCVPLFLYDRHYDIPYDCNGIVSNCSVTANKLLESNSIFNDIDTGVGGLVGCNSKNTKIVGCFAKIKSIESNGEAGGFVAYNEGDIEKCYSVVDEIQNNTDILDLGGFAGFTRGHIDNCYADCGSILSKNNNATEHIVEIGGFAGGAEGEISNCYVKSESVLSTIPESSFSFHTCVGGFVGSASRDITITNCYADITEMSGNGYLGSFIGGFDNYLEEPYNLDCYSSFVTNGELPFVDNEFVSVSNCYTLPNGYDSSKAWGDHPWNPTIWNLQDGALPTLKGLPEN